jgi:hypothetical protein
MFTSKHLATKPEGLEDAVDRLQFALRDDVTIGTSALLIHRDNTLWAWLRKHTLTSEDADRAYVDGFPAVIECPPFLGDVYEAKIKKALDLSTQSVDQSEFNNFLSHSVPYGPAPYPPFAFVSQKPSAPPFSFPSSSSSYRPSVDSSKKKTRVPFIVQRSARIDEEVEDKPTRLQQTNELGRSIPTTFGSGNSSSSSSSSSSFSPLASAPSNPYSYSSSSSYPSRPIVQEEEKNEYQGTALSSNSTNPYTSRSIPSKSYKPPSSSSYLPRPTFGHAEEAGATISSPSSSLPSNSSSTPFSYSSSSATPIVPLQSATSSRWSYPATLNRSRFDSIKPMAMQGRFSLSGRDPLVAALVSNATRTEEEERALQYLLKIASSYGANETPSSIYNRTRSQLDICQKVDQWGQRNNRDPDFVEWKRICAEFV